MLNYWQTALKHYQRALAQWPKDALRPDVSFIKAMQTRMEQRFGPQIKTGEVPISPSSPSAPGPDEALELEQANALYSFLENRYAKKVLQKLFTTRTP